MNCVLCMVVEAAKNLAPTQPPVRLAASCAGTVLTAVHDVGFEPVYASLCPTHARLAKSCEGTTRGLFGVTEQSS